MLSDLQHRHLPGGPPLTFLSVDGGRSRISSSGTSQRVRRQRFLALMMDAHGSPAPTPPKGPAVGVFYVDGGCSQISVSTHQEARRQCFLALMVGAPGSPAPAPPRGARHRHFLVLMVSAPGSPAPPPRRVITNIQQLSGSRSQISSNGVTMSTLFLRKKITGPCTAKDLKR
jgi:hypothetical protein